MSPFAGDARDPASRGRRVAELFATQAPELFRMIAESEPWRAARPRPDAAREWEVFALYACVRGLVAAGGFNRETASAIDALHEMAMANWPGGLAPESESELRQRISDRYAEYGAIGQEGGKSGAATVTLRLGEAAARHMVEGGPFAEMAEVIGGLHESLAEAVAAELRRIVGG